MYLFHSIDNVKVTQFVNKVREQSISMVGFRLNSRTVLVPYKIPAVSQNLSIITSL